MKKELYVTNEKMNLAEKMNKLKEKEEKGEKAANGLIMESGRVL